jgi:site-specific recombinase XerC
MDRVSELTGLDVRHVDIEIPALITPERGRRVL